LLNNFKGCKATQKKYYIKGTKMFSQLLKQHRQSIKQTRPVMLACENTNSLWHSAFIGNDIERYENRVLGDIGV
jgi:hypothetical protein